MTNSFLYVCLKTYREAFILFWFSQRKENLENYCYNGAKNREKRVSISLLFTFSFSAVFYLLTLVLVCLSPICHEANCINYSFYFLYP